MPSAAIAGSSSRVRSVSSPNTIWPVSGRVLPVTTSIIVVLPAPFGPITARISPGSIASDNSFSARNPSKVTLTPSRYSRVSRLVHPVTSRSSRHLEHRADRGFRLLGRRRPARHELARGASSPISPRGRNSVTTMNSAPSAYSHNSGRAPVNQVLPRLTSTAPRIAPDKRAAAADRDPDHRLDRIDRRELARVDDPDLWHIERAADPGHHRRQDEHEQLVRFRPVAEKAGARLGVAHRDQHLAEARPDHRAREQIQRRQHEPPTGTAAPPACPRPGSESREYP